MSDTIQVFYELGMQNNHTKRFTVFPKRRIFRDLAAVQCFLNSEHKAPPGTEWVIITNKYTPGALAQPPTTHYYWQQQAYLEFDKFINELFGGDHYEALLIDTTTGKYKRPFLDRPLKFGVQCAFDELFGRCPLKPQYQWVTLPAEQAERPHSPYKTAVGWFERNDIRSECT